MKVALTSQQFAALRDLLADVAGLVFDDTRRESMSYSIAERLRETGLRDVDAYLQALQDPGERQRLVDEVTIQETHFFRNPPQVRALRLHVLPELLRQAESNGRRLRIWSAGCSTGEEPYSIAMLLRELLPADEGWDVKVLATDVSQRALASARAGRYGARAVMNASPEELSRFFLPSDGRTYEVRPEVRALVEFRHHNLVTEPVPFPSNEHIDLVLCRNVTIYFSRETTRALMKRLHECLRDGGYLFLGHSETLWRVSDDFRLVSLGTGESAAFVYRRLDVRGSERRAVLPDRRTGEDPKPAERRVKLRRAERLVEILNKPVPLPSVAKPKPKPADADEQVARARAALAQGRYDEAAALAAEAVAVEPMRAEAFYLRGLALVDLGDDDRAMVELRKAVYLEPRMGFAHFLLAGVLDRLGDRAASAREYGAAADTLGLAPGDATAEELGGRSVRELAQLCRVLERRYSGDRVEEVG
ncbi:MAG TPA: CheR family methyltransferase [Mycobacteriales bacterium]|nr:CheR family methyltransferase [Mycobacteriales bacterium]